VHRIVVRAYRHKITIEEHTYVVDFSVFHDISIPVTTNSSQLSAFSLPSASFAAVEGGGFVGDTRRGGSVNCEKVIFCPHGNGTHTECIGHLTKERISILDVFKNQSTFMIALVISVIPEPIGQCGDHYPAKHEDNELVVSKRIVESAIKSSNPLNYLPEALIIRTLPNSVDKKTQIYSGNNPVYVTPNLSSSLRNAGVMHLLVDLPSLDREDDEGILASHSQFWNNDKTDNRTITELCFVDDSIPDGIYLLNLQIAPFYLDASPSRPLLHPITKDN